MKTILILSCTLGLVTSAFANDHLPTATEILEEGKILHKEVYRNDQSHFFQIDFFVIYDDKYFFCVANPNAVTCDKRKVLPSYSITD